MFDLGLSEIFVIMVVALLVLGPEKMPEVARGLGKTVRHFQRLLNEVRDTLRMEELTAELRNLDAPRLDPTPPPAASSATSIDWDTTQGQPRARDFSHLPTPLPAVAVSPTVGATVAPLPDPPPTVSDAPA